MWRDGRWKAVGQKLQILVVGRFLGSCLASQAKGPQRLEN
jgi:hypothetical protein